MGVFFGLVSGVQTGMVLGILSGIGFGVAIAIFIEIQTTKMESKDGLFEGEKVIYQGGANHFLNAESRGGWLTLTESRLCFRSHGTNVQNQPLNIPVSSIENVQSSLTLGIVPNGLKITLSTGKSEAFVVSTRKNWIKYLSHQVKANKIYPSD